MGHLGGRYGKGGDILFRWGNPLVYKCGDEGDQRLFNQHCAQFTPEGGVLVFNNGQAPQRHWSSVDEDALETDCPKPDPVCLRGDTALLWRRRPGLPAACRG